MSLWWINKALFVRALKPRVVCIYYIKAESITNRRLRRWWKLPSRADELRKRHCISPAELAHCILVRSSMGCVVHPSLGGGFRSTSFLPPSPPPTPTMQTTANSMVISISTARHWGRVLSQKKVIIIHATHRTLHPGLVLNNYIKLNSPPSKSSTYQIDESPSLT